MANTHILVCGGGGFIGRNLLERLAARQDVELSATYHTRPPAAPSAAPVRWLKADLTDAKQVGEVVRGKTIVIQAAAVTSGAKDTITRPYLHVTDNAVMNSLIFRACFEHQVQHVVFFSCATMYPSQREPVREDAVTYQLEEKYFGVGWTKVYLEKMCEFYSRIGTTKYTAIRHSNIYGPYDKFDLERSHVFGATMTKVLRATDGTIRVWGDGSEARDLLYVSDLVHFVETVIDAQRDRFELINVGCGRGVTVRELVERIMTLAGRPLSIEFDRSQPTIPFNVALDISRARAKYGWEPRVSLDEGIRKTLDWYRAYLLPGESAAHRSASQLTSDRGVAAPA